MTKSTLITRREVAEMTGFSVNYLATANGRKRFPVAEILPTGRVLYNKRQVKKILESLMKKRSADNYNNSNKE
jgi:hypothetical protein